MLMVLFTCHEADRHCWWAFCFFFVCVSPLVLLRLGIPQRGTADAEINVTSVENPAELTTLTFFL